MEKKDWDDICKVYLSVYRGKHAEEELKQILRYYTLLKDNVKLGINDYVCYFPKDIFKCTLKKGGYVLESNSASIYFMNSKTRKRQKISRKDNFIFYIKSGAGPKFVMMEE